MMGRLQKDLGTVDTPSRGRNRNPKQGGVLLTVTGRLNASASHTCSSPVADAIGRPQAPERRGERRASGALMILGGGPDWPVTARERL